MNFLSIPKEVIEGNLLPYLQWNDLLRFRRVCKVTKEITQAYMKVHPELAPEIEIGEDDANRSLGAFLKMNIPTNRIFLNNESRFEFYQKNTKIIAKFLKKCGPLVKHLRVKELSLYTCGKEWDFLDALVNLESFEAEYFGYGTKDTSLVVLARATKESLARAKQDPRFVNYLHPKIFNQIKSVRIGNQEGVMVGNITNRTGTFLERSHSLEHASLPFCSHFQATQKCTIPEGYQPHLAMGLAFMIIDKELKDRASKFPDKPHLKTLDFRCYHGERGIGQVHAYGSGMFLELLKNCIKYGIQLKNVGAMWFTQWGDRPDVRSPDLGIPVLSLVNLNPCILPVNMPNLERVEIQATNRSSPGLQWREQRPDWPALKSVDITVDCKTISGTFLENGQEVEAFNQDAKEIFQFFFQDVQRTNLTEIRLNFIKEPKEVAIPKTDEIVDSCPNLKKITLINWPGSNKALTKLWNKLPGLEEISLEYCKELGNVAFVGQDAKNPVFFKLKKLRKLTLKGLDQMPKITDTLFSLVLRHLNLTHLILTSDRPVKSITGAGISSMLEGSFAKTIEKFPFHHWSLKGVSAAEFKKMEVKFRSYNML